MIPGIGAKTRSAECSGSCLASGRDAGRTRCRSMEAVERRSRGRGWDGCSTDARTRSGTVPVFSCSAAHRMVRVAILSICGATEVRHHPDCPVGFSDRDAGCLAVARDGREFHSAVAELRRYRLKSLRAPSSRLGVMPGDLDHHETLTQSCAVALGADMVQLRNHVKTFGMVDKTVALHNCPDPIAIQSAREYDI